MPTSLTWYLIFDVQTACSLCCKLVYSLTPPPAFLEQFSQRYWNAVSQAWSPKHSHQIKQLCFQIVTIFFSQQSYYMNSFLKLICLQLPPSAYSPFPISLSQSPFFHVTTGEHASHLCIHPSIHPFIYPEVDSCAFPPAVNVIEPGSFVRHMAT